MFYKTLFYLEYIKLLRKSNILFLFLAIYLFATPIGRGFDEINSAEQLSAEDIFIAMVNSFSIMGLLLLSIFMVNSIGNEFSEGSYRKNLAMGLTKTDYMKGKIMLILFLLLFIIVSTLVIYFIFSFFFLKSSFLEVFKAINLVSILNQSTALLGSSFFGLFIIMVFRNRTIGLVFFPFWFVTEFIVFIVNRSGNSRLISDYLPGVSFYGLYIKQMFDMHSFSIAVIYATIFFVSAWYGLELREEKLS